MPFPLHDGGSLSVYNTALGLINQKIDVKIFALNTPKKWVNPEIIPQSFRTKTGFEFAKVDTRINPVKALMNLFSKKSYFITRFISNEFNNHLTKILKAEEFDIIQLEHIYMCLYLKTIRKNSNAKIILRPQNIESQVWDRYLENISNPLKKQYLQVATYRLLRFEKEISHKVDGIMAISPNDSKIFRKWAPETPVVKLKSES